MWIRAYSASQRCRAASADPSPTDSCDSSALPFGPRSTCNPAAMAPPALEALPSSQFAEVLARLDRLQSELGTSVRISEAHARSALASSASAPSWHVARSAFKFWQHKQEAGNAAAAQEQCGPQRQPSASAHGRAASLGPSSLLPADPFSTPPSVVLRDDDCYKVPLGRTGACRAPCCPDHGAATLPHQCLYSAARRQLSRKRPALPQAPLLTA
jgi:hypothetical protein